MRAERTTEYSCGTGQRDPKGEHAAASRPHQSRRQAPLCRAPLGTRLAARRHMDSFLSDLRLGMRMLLKAPAFTAVSVLALALGIGANAVMFSVAGTVLLRPLAYRDAERLMWIETIER